MSKEYVSEAFKNIIDKMITSRDEYYKEIRDRRIHEICLATGCSEVYATRIYEQMIEVYGCGAGEEYILSVSLDSFMASLEEIVRYMNTVTSSFDEAVDSLQKLAEEIWDLYPDKPFYKSRVQHKTNYRNENIKPITKVHVKINKRPYVRKRRYR